MPSFIKQNQHFILSYGLPSLAIAVIFILIFSPALSASYDLTDDHEVIRATRVAQMPGYLQEIARPITWQNALNNIRTMANGRFRPAFEIIDYVESAIIWRTNWTLWHVSRVVMAIVMGIVFYVAARRVNMKIWAALLFVVCIVAQDYAAEIWFRLGASETWSMFFLSFAVLGIVLAAEQAQPGRWDVVAALMLVLMGTSKETFVLIIPALMVLRVALHYYFHEADDQISLVVGPLGLRGQGWRAVLTWPKRIIVHFYQEIFGKLQLWRVLKTLARPLLLDGLIFAVLGWFVYAAYNHGGYGASIVSTDNTGTVYLWLVMLKAIAWRFAKYIPLAVYLLIVLYEIIRERALKIQLLAGIVIGGLFVLPTMFFIVSYSGYSNMRYAYPGYVGFAALIAFALSEIGKRNRWVYAACIVVTAAYMLNMGLNTYMQSLRFAEKTHTIANAVDYVVAHADPDKVVVLHADPIATYEHLYAMELFLGASGVTSPIYITAAGGRDPSESSLMAGSLLSHFRERVDTSVLPADVIAELDAQSDGALGRDLTTDDVGVIFDMYYTDTYLTENPPVWFDTAVFEATEIQASSYYRDRGSRRNWPWFIKTGDPQRTYTVWVSQED